MQIHELTDEMTSIADAGNYLAVDNGVVTAKIDYLRLAKAIIEVYNGSSINGSNQTLQTAIAGLQGQIDDSYITADTYVDFYNQCTALPNGKLVTFACESAVSSKITGGAVTAALKGFIQKTDASTNRFDFFGYVGSGYMYAYRCQFVSSSEVVVQYSKSTQKLETDIATLNSKAISYVDVSGTTGTSLYGSYYYVNIAIPVAARDGFISASILTSGNYRYAVVQRLSNTQIRVYCDESEKSVSVRIAYQ